MAKEIGDKELIETWGSTGTVVEPSVSKQTGGWQFEEQPPHEYMNWVHNKLGQQTNYLMRSGVPEWSAATDYAIGNYVAHNGSLWASLATNTNSEPTTGNTNWAKMPRLSDLATVASTGLPEDLVGVSASAAELNILDGATLTTAELNHVDGVTSPIQTQLNARLEIDSKASQAEANAGTNDAKYMTPLKVRESLGDAALLDAPTNVDLTISPNEAARRGVVANAISNVAGQAIGVGQTWQDLTGSRSGGVSYQNTTGRPIQIACRFSGISSRQFEVSLDNLSFTTVMSQPDNAGNGVFVVVPEGVYYRINSTSGLTIQNWSELR